ncbi:MAG TPA: ATP-binding protein, partial [Herpetosiphonaceae bacterium]
MEDYGISASASSPPWPADIAQAAVHASQNILIVLDAVGIIRYVNAAATSSLQYSAAQLIGASFVELLDPGSRNKGRALLAQAVPRQMTSVFELNQSAGDGQIMLIGYQAVALPSDAASNGAGPKILLVGQRMGNVVATTERLINLNRRLKALFTIVTAASRSIVLADLLHQALSVAIAELDLLAGLVLLADVPVEIDRAQYVPQLAPDQLRLAAQQGFTPAFIARLSEPQQFSAFWNNIIRRGEPSVVSGSADEVGIQASDLERLSDMLLTVIATPLIGERQLQGWLYVVTDRYRAASSDEVELLRTIGNLLGPVVENARLYDALLQTSGRLQAVLDGIDSGVLLLDQEDIVRYANARLGALFGVDVAGWPGKPRVAVVPTTVVPLAQSADAFHGELWEVIGPQRRILGRFADQVYDVNGMPLGSIEVYSDMTSFQEMNRLKDEFVVAAAHDLKTPVTAIKGYAQIATRLARKLDEPRLLQQLAMINARSDELAYLMDGLLDMSRIQGGRLWLDRETIHVDALIASVAKHFEFDLARRGRKLITDLPDMPLEVTWDRLRMEGVLINLIGNALKYSPDGGEIIVGAHLSAGATAHDGWVEITVTDHGIGIPPAERDLIFERFYRARHAIEQGFKGTGIGLYITRHIVELHGGRIWVGDALHGGPGTTI